MATKGKTAAKPAPVAAVEDEAAGFEVGQRVKFLGYAEDTPENEQILTADEVYQVVGVTEPDENGEGGGNPVVSIPNPDFNAKKKEHPDTNPKTLDVEAFAEEVELVEGEEEEAAEEEVAEEVAPAKPAAKSAKPAAKTAPAKPAAKTAPAKAAPAKAAGKTVAAKATKPAKAVKEPAPEPEVVDETPDLENEDPDVVALIEGSADLIATAQELEAEAGSIEWKLGGVLYHIKKDKSYEQLEGGAEYALPGGFQKFLMEYFNIEYRKAMYLIDIYKYFTIAGIEDAASKVATIGWTKAKTIAKLLTAEGQDAGELIELAENNTVSDLSEAIKEQVSVGGTPGEKKTRVTFKFHLFEEEGASVKAIMEAAQEQLGLKNLDEVLVHIVNEWASEHGGGTATKAAAPAQRAVAPAKKPAAVARKAVAKA